MRSHVAPCHLFSGKENPDRNGHEANKRGLLGIAGGSGTGSRIITIRAWDFWFPLISGVPISLRQSHDSVQLRTADVLGLWRWELIPVPTPPPPSHGRKQRQTRSPASRIPFAANAFEVPPRFMLFTHSCCTSPQGALFPIIFS